MKRTLIILTFLILPLLTHGQYVSPGTGATYTLAELVSVSQGAITHEGETFFIHTDITVSNTDKLLINKNSTIKVAAGVLLTFIGTLESNPPVEAVFTAIDPEAPFKGFRFVGSSASVLRNTIIEYSGGLQLINSHMLVEDCVFRYNDMSHTAGAITLSNSHPVIRYNQFFENAGSAISSNVNSTSSPQILFNQILRNGTANTNRPQINLGPGGEDTLRIIGNRVTGAFPMAGGIGISNMLGIGQTRAVVKDNTITDNRYGYAQIGNNIHVVVTGNTVINNNIQNDPQQGGSGLNFYGTLNTNQALVSRNIIRGNLWGVTIQGNAQPNLGSNGRNREITGNNIIEGNGNGGQLFALYNNTSNTIQAQFNFWGTTDLDEVRSGIFGRNQNSDLGTVNFENIWMPTDIIQSFHFEIEKNEEEFDKFEGVIDNQNNTITLKVPVGTDISRIAPVIGLPEHALILPLPGQTLDFSMPVAYTVTPFDGPDRTYLVFVEMEEPRNYSINFNINAGGQLVDNARITFDGYLFEPGEYSFEDLEPGVYDFLVEKNGFITVDGTIVIETKDVSLNVDLEPIATTEPVLFTQQLTVFPNPAKEYIEVNHNGRRANNSVRIFSITGTMMMEVPNVGKGQRIEITNLDNGLYLLQFNQDDTTLTRKFTVAR